MQAKACDFNKQQGNIYFETNRSFFLTDYQLKKTNKTESMA